MQKKFRKCAGAVVFNKEGNVFLGNRIETATTAWQFPQGGIENEETPLDAAKRELFEETGIHSVSTVLAGDIFHRYEFTEEIKQAFRQRGIFNDGQDICFSLFYFTGSESEINLNTAQPEFKEYCWESLDFAVKHIVDFKKDVYKSVANALAPVIKQYIDNIS